MKKIFRDNIIFLSPYMVILITVLPLFVLFSKSDIHLWINSHYSHFFDFFFRLVTLLGDGIFVCIAGALMLIWSFRNSFLIFASYLLSGLVVQIFKRIVFTDSPRPSVFFEGYASLRLVSGVEMHGSGSFPSGHSATAFAFFLSAALIAKNNTIKLLCLMTAVLIAFSRVYLSQHFLADIYAGSVIGVVSSLLVFLYIKTRNRKWHELSLLRIANFKNSNTA